MDSAERKNLVWGDNDIVSDRERVELVAPAAQRSVLVERQHRLYEGVRVEVGNTFDGRSPQLVVAANSEILWFIRIATFRSLCLQANAQLPRRRWG